MRPPNYESNEKKLTLQETHNIFFCSLVGMFMDNEIYSIETFILLYTFVVCTNCNRFEARQIKMIGIRFLNIRKK